MPRRPVPARLATAVLCATLVLASCGTDETATDQPSPGEGSVGESTGTRGVTDARRPSPTWRGRLDVAEEEIAVERVEEVTWNDGSLGCARRGRCTPRRSWTAAGSR